MNTRIFLLTLSCVLATDFGYLPDSSQGTGPEEWMNDYAQCGGDEQSPIPLHAATYEEFDDLNMTYLEETDVKFWNTGVTIQVETSINSDHILSGGPLTGDYYLDYFHFRWGSTSDAGSEHTIDGHVYPFEVQFSHHNSAYSNASAAMESGDREAFASIAILFEIGEVNPILDELIEVYPYEHEAESAIPVFDFSGFFGQLASKRFYHYLGSFTTPPCQEIVSWIVMEERLTLSLEQLEAFEHVLLDENTKISQNHRPLQDTGDRILKQSWPVVVDEETTVGSIDHGHVAFGYNDVQGITPEHWGEYWEDCNGDAQSPIDIQGAVYEQFEDLTFGHKIEENVTVDNNGHSSIIHLQTPESHVLSGGPLNGTYDLYQFHFHWGRNTREAGSEHLFHGKGYPLEAHFVHARNSYGGIQAAIDSGDRDAIAVVGMVFEFGEHNPIINTIEEHYPNEHEEHLKIQEFDFGGFFKQLSSTRFYNYYGSFTTPPCYEIVNWIVMKDHLTIATDQLGVFHGTLFDSINPIGRNYRPTQPIGARAVKQSWKDVVSDLAPDCFEDCKYGDLGEYWVEKFDQSELDPTLVAICCNSFYYDEKWTCVGSGDYDMPCNSDFVYCPSCSEDSVYGSGNCQTEAVADAVNSENGIHPQCPGHGALGSGPRTSCSTYVILILCLVTIFKLW